MMLTLAIPEEVERELTRLTAAVGRKNYQPRLE
jgi:hypothetical protein